MKRMITILIFLTFLYPFSANALEGTTGFIFTEDSNKKVVWSLALNYSYKTERSALIKEYYALNKYRTSFPGGNHFIRIVFRTYKDFDFHSDEFVIKQAGRMIPYRLILYLKDYGNSPKEIKGPVVKLSKWQGIMGWLAIPKGVSLNQPLSVEFKGERAQFVFNPYGVFVRK